MESIGWENKASTRLTKERDTTGWKELATGRLVCSIYSFEGLCRHRRRRISDFKLGFHGDLARTGGDVGVIKRPSEFVVGEVELLDVP